MKRILVLLVLCASLGTTWATNVTLRLVDQTGGLIPGSQFSILTPPGGLVQQEGTTDLPTGVHTIRVFPGINGITQGSVLFRDETINVSGIAQTVEFTWKLGCVPGRVEKV